MEEEVPKKSAKLHNNLPLWGNEATMNLNPLILANIQSSSYFKVHLFKLKTYHEVVDEIYYQVKHMEPWERGSRKTSGQTGMCGGVRGVGAGGIVSTAFCLLYKLYTLRLTRKQVNGLLNHTDSPYIRALGFMYLRYTQPPGDLYDWYEDYLQDEEEIDVKAGGGQTITIGHMVYQFLTKLDWFSTLFPRIPVPMQKQIERKLAQYCQENGVQLSQLYASKRKTSAPPAEEDNYNARAAGRDSSASRATASGSYRWGEHDDREATRERQRDDYEFYGERERGRDYERESRFERSRERDRERERSRRDYERADDRRDLERVDERRDYERSKERRDYERSEVKREGRERVREESDRHRDKHKKKKRKHHRSSRSRSRSHSRSVSKRERKREREARSNSVEERKRR